MLTAGFSKAYSSLLAFVAGPARLRHYLKLMVPTYCYGGPVRWRPWPPPCSGWRRTSAAATSCGPSSTTGPDPARPPGQARGRDLQHLRLPLVELAMADPEDAPAAGRHLFERGIYVTMDPYPVVPREEVGFRVQLTAANTIEQVEHPLAVLQEIDDRFGFRRPHP